MGAAIRERGVPSEHLNSPQTYHTMALIRPNFRRALLQKQAQAAAEDLKPVIEKTNEDPEHQEPKKKISTRKQTTTKTTEL